jgi:hypothetical protein
MMESQDLELTAGNWIITGNDLLENAKAAKEEIKKEFPAVSVKITTDRNEIAKLPFGKIPDKHVLIQAEVPRNTDTVKLMRTWSEALNGGVSRAM